jgi:hypothetical protein
MTISSVGSTQAINTRMPIQPVAAEKPGDDKTVAGTPKNDHDSDDKSALSTASTRSAASVQSALTGLKAGG